MIFLLVFASIVGFIMIHSFANARSRTHNANVTRADRDFVNGVGPELPSWFGDKDKVEIFCHGVAMLSEKHGMPISMTKMVFAKQKSNAPIFAFAAKLEKQGSTFSEMQLGTSQFLLHTWNELPLKDQLEVTNLAAGNA